MKFYLLGDSLTLEEARSLGIEKHRLNFSTNISPRDVEAVRTGEFREPKAGEWYLSGAIPTAYRARGDCGDKFHIMRIVKVKTVTTKRIVQ